LRDVLKAEELRRIAEAIVGIWCDLQRGESGWENEVRKKKSEQLEHSFEKKKRSAGDEMSWPGTGLTGVRPRLNFFELFFCPGSARQSTSSNSPGPATPVQLRRSGTTPHPRRSHDHRFLAVEWMWSIFLRIIPLYRLRKADVDVRGVDVTGNAQNSLRL